MGSEGKLEKICSLVLFQSFKLSASNLSIQVLIHLTSFSRIHLVSFSLVRA